MAENNTGNGEPGLPVQGSVWPPPPVIAPTGREPEPLPLAVESAVGKHLSAARRFFVFSLLITPIFCLPFVFYHAVQANRKGGRGQGTWMLVGAWVYLGLTVLALTTLLVGGR